MSERNKRFASLNSCSRNPFIFCLLALLLASHANADEVWVRVHVAEQDPMVTQLRSSSQLADYGNMLFGRLDETTAGELERRGHRVQVSDNPFLVTLGEETFDPAERGARTALPVANPDGDFHFIQFEGPIRPEWLDGLRRNGVEIVQALHPFSYFVWASNNTLQAVDEHPAIRWSQPMETGWKVQPHLRSFSSEARPTMLMTSAHGDLRGRIARLREFGQVSVVREYGDHFVLVQIDDLPGNRYVDVANVPGVYTVQYIRPEAGPRGEMSNQSIVGNIDGGTGNVLPGYATWLNDTGYDGSGVTVGVVDGRVLTTHLDLADRMVSCDGTNGSCGGTGSDDHGTHVAGAIAGTGNTGTLLNGFLRGQGMAPGANLVTQRYQPFLGAGPGGMVTDGMLDIYQDSARSGALLTNNSWGPTGSPQGYDIPTRQIDFISRDADPDTPGDQPILAVWSIMNGGGDSGGACAPSSLGSPDEAKNLFAVGSTALQDNSGNQVGNIFRISTNSAHGNACDGRRRPDIVAPGCNTDSTINSSNSAHGVSGWCGTSMASPVVSGAVAVWSEKHIEQNGQNPSPALTKAVFTAAARDLVGNPNADGGTMGHRPDRFQGYGRIDLEAVMNHGGEVYMTDQETVFTSTGDSWSLDLNAVDPAQPIRIMLAWTDAPGAGLGGSTPAWVNNIDLAVEANGNTYLGNVIGPDGWSATGGSADDRNNLEGVFLNPAQHGGAVNITVDATDIAGDALNPWSPGAPSQDFALVCYNCIVGNPTFEILIGGNPLEACIPDSGSTDYALSVNLSPFGPYSGTVDLASTGLPAGVTEDFASSSVSVPGSTTWTLTVDSSASEGSGNVEVTGNDGSIVQSAMLDLDLERELSAGPSLTGPIDGASDLGLQPTLSWAPIAGITDYQLIVFPTDVPFALIDTTVNGTSFEIPFELEIGTSYSWRVAGRNNCGEGTYSETRTFTTRQEPVAEFSVSAFSMTVPADASDSTPLEISNIGTGNLTWSVATDQLDGVAGRGVIDPIYNEVLNVPNFSVTGDASGGNTEVFTIPGGVLTQGTVLGFEFEGTVSGISGTLDWASDLRMIITSPEGTVFDVGGLSNQVVPWDFNGSQSDLDGTYTSSHPDAFDPGTSDDGDWSLSFQHDWVAGSAGTMNWSNVTVTLLKAPPPFCIDPLSAVAWLSVTPDSGSVAEAGSELVSVDIDTTGMVPGSYTGYLCISTNDPAAALTPMSVELTVTVGDPVFEDRFEGQP
jgi:hypothetical protein